MPFQLTTAVIKMLRMKARKKVIQGSTSSGKTYGIIPIIYDKLIANERWTATVTAETLGSLKDGALKIFKDFMMDEGRWDDARWNATDNIYILANKSRLQFKSFDSVGKAKAAGKREILFINEANHLPWDIAYALIIRSTEDQYFDFNADEEFWAHTEVLNSPDSEFLKLTYKDNEGIPPTTLSELMEIKRKAELEEKAGVKGYWYNYWMVYGLGEVGQRLELVFAPWDVMKVKPARFTKFVYGIDFGYQHPTALIKIWYHEDERYIEEEIFAPLLSSPKLLAKMSELNISREVEMIGDYARPEMISDLRDAGYYVLNADKSVDAGIEDLRKCKVYVSESAVNVIRENKKYKYKKMNGLVTDVILKINDDAMDAIRYGNRWITKYSVGDFEESFSFSL